MKGYEDLIKTLKTIQTTHGMDITPEAVTDYQDMIGTSTLEQLAELANGVYKETFYKVYDAAYGTIETIRFYLNNSEKIQRLQEEKADQEAEIDELNFFLEEQKKDTAAQREARQQIQEKYAETAEQNAKQEAEIKALKAQLQELKAKLYDLMTA